VLNVELKIIGRKKASDIGLPRYFTGIECKNGHLDERLVSTRNCRTCSRERSAKDNKKRKSYFSNYYKSKEYKERKKKLLKIPSNAERKRVREKERYHENIEKMRIVAVDKYRNMTEKQHINRRKTKSKNMERKEVKMINTMRHMVFRCLRLTGNKKSTSTEPLLGYKRNDLIKHLESLFSTDMSWDNYGKHWEIDHVIPISYCIKCGIEDPSLINQLENLQPLTVQDNRSKNNKVPLNIKINGLPTK
jgi:hypothetical protein